MIRCLNWRVCDYRSVEVEQHRSTGGEEGQGGAAAARAAAACFGQRWMLRHAPSLRRLGNLSPTTPPSPQPLSSHDSLATSVHHRPHGTTLTFCLTNHLVNCAYISYTSIHRSHTTHTTRSTIKSHFIISHPLSPWHQIQHPQSPS